MMNALKFWGLIEKNKENPQKITLDLNKLSMDDFLDFSRRYYSYYKKLNKKHDIIWSFISQNNFHDSCDGYEYFLYNLIHRGIDICEAALSEDKDELLKLINKLDDPQFKMHEEWQGIIPNIYFMRTVENIDELKLLFDDSLTYVNRTTEFYRLVDY